MIIIIGWCDGLVQIDNIMQQGPSCQVTLDISRSPIDFQWGSWKYPG